MADAATMSVADVGLAAITTGLVIGSPVSKDAGRMRKGGRMREGGCLCGHIRYRAEAEAIWPHLCSCAHCQRLGALR
ncbi:GFA family protein [Nocardia takedensis]|uniref:GFA family protein n=1 Tax=Nocardia takedensis TaxID=259390 RepID=UPI003F7663A7